jgi:alanyl-tRNA synthetase
MNPQLLYQEDVTILEFDAHVIEVRKLPNGRLGVLLDHSYFYPTGGGQEHDTGRIGSGIVVDIFKDENTSQLVHAVEGEVGLGSTHASIDAERRLRNMQHHTAQHLLTQCILRQTGFETVSANINGYTPSTLDIMAPQIATNDLDQAERLANQVIYENRMVKSYFVNPEQLRSIPVRKPPKVAENIRIVEIDGYDYSPCGGTHVLNTGSIGLIKVLKAERQNDKQRIHYVAGWQALELFKQMYASLITVANQMSMSWQDVPMLLEKQAEQLALLQKELQSLRQSTVKYEVRELIEAAENIQGVRLVRAAFSSRMVGELRLLAEELKKTPNMVAYLATFDGQKVSLIVTCAENAGKDARLLLNRQLARINGRGGGDAHFAQGGGVITTEQYSIFLKSVDLG